MQIEERFKPLLDEALADMNREKFDYYLSWKDKRYKNKWDILKTHKFQTYLGWSSMRLDNGHIFFQPDGLLLQIGLMEEADKCFIPIDECKKIFENQGKQVYIQEKLF